MICKLEQKKFWRMTPIQLAKTTQPELYEEVLCQNLLQVEGGTLARMVIEYLKYLSKSSPSSFQWENCQLNSI